MLIDIDKTTDRCDCAKCTLYKANLKEQAEQIADMAKSLELLKSENQRLKDDTINDDLLLEVTGLNKMLDVRAEQIRRLEIKCAARDMKIRDLKTELAASQSSNKALETLYLQIRDEELVEAKAEAEKYRDTLYSAKMMDKDKEIQRLKDDIALYEVSINVSGEWSKSKLAEIQRLKERLEVAEDVIHRNELTVYYRQALAAQPQKESECNV